MTTEITNKTDESHIRELLDKWAYATRMGLRDDVLAMSLLHSA